jgi:hypothetical protein
MKKKTLYEFLGVEPEATPEEIKTAALSLAEKFHPSKYPGNPRVAARFKKIKRVYNTLANPQKRAAYDATLAKEPAQPALNSSLLPEKPIINNKTVHQAGETNTKIVRETRSASEAAKANSVQNSSPQPQKVQTQYASQEKNTSNEPQPVGEMNKLRTKIHWFLNLIAAFLFMGIGAYFLLIDPAILTEYVDKIDFLQDKLLYITLSSWVILGLGILILVHTLWATFTTILTRNKNHVEDIKLNDNTQTKQVIKETEAAAAKNPAQASTKKPPATVPQKTQKLDNPPKRVTQKTAAKNPALATAKKQPATVSQNMAANPQKRVAQNAAAAKKTVPATAKKQPATVPQKTAANPQRRVVQKAAAAKKPVPATAKKQPATVPQKTAANPQRRVAQNAAAAKKPVPATAKKQPATVPQKTVANPQRRVAQKAGAAKKPVPATAKKQPATVPQKTVANPQRRVAQKAGAAKKPVPATAKKQPATVPQKKTLANPQKRVDQKAAATKKTVPATAKKQPATVPQKTLANPQKRVDQNAAAAKKPALATAKKPVATLPQKTPDKEKMDGRAAKTHGLGYSFALFMIGIGTYLLWIEPTLLKESVKNVDWLQNQLPYVTLGTWMIFGLGLLILLHRLFKTLTTTSTKNKNQEIKPVEEPETLGQASSEAAAETGVNALGEQSATPPQKRQEEDSEKEKIVGPTKIHWLGYSFALLLIIIPAYLLLIEPTQLNNLLKPIEFLQDKRVYIKLSLQGLLVLGILILLLTKFQPFKNKNRVNEIKPLKKTPDHPQKPTTIEASAVQNQSAQNPQHPKKLSVSDVLAKHQKRGEKTHTVRWVSEKILYRADIHGFGYIMGLFFIGISIYFLLFKPTLLENYVNHVYFLQDKLSFVTVGLQTVLGLGVFILLRTLFQQFTTTLMITSERIIARFGLISIRQIEIKLAQFENLEIKQSLLGKILGFGTLKIRGTRGKGVGGIKINVSNVTSPKQFEKRLMRLIKQTAYHQI